MTRQTVGSKKNGKKTGFPVRDSRPVLFEIYFSLFPFIFLGEILKAHKLYNYLPDWFMLLDYLLSVRLHVYIFYASNTIFWSCGWGALAVGIWLYKQKSLYSVLAPTSYSAMSAAGLCVAIGAMILIISFIGCVSVWLKSKSLMISFFCFVSLLFLIQCMTGVMGFMYEGVVKERAKITLLHTINDTYYGDNPKATLLWNTWNQMQIELKCCGVDNFTDWFFYPRWKGRRFVPDSCCELSKFKVLANSSLNCGKSTESYPFLYLRGCAEPFTDWLLQHLRIVGMMALLFGIVELVVLSSSLRLLYNFHQNEKKRRHSIVGCKHSDRKRNCAQNGSLLAFD
uniref:Tetraspanin n=1 Tax=Globodera pallida TaxID=36090 RepID=A0A183CBB0_GLOPA